MRIWKGAIDKGKLNRTRVSLFSPTSETPNSSIFLFPSSYFPKESSNFLFPPFKGLKRKKQWTKKKLGKDEKERAIPEILNKEYFKDYFNPYLKDWAKKKIKKNK
jgi:hypothetical protein